MSRETNKFREADVALVIFNYSQITLHTSQGILPGDVNTTYKIKVSNRYYSYFTIQGEGNCPSQGLWQNWEQSQDPIFYLIKFQLRIAFSSLKWKSMNRLHHVCGREKASPEL